MDEYTRELVVFVADGNPGALHYILEMAWFSDWYKMLCWLRDHKIIGSRLYEIIHDNFHGDYHAYVEVLQRDMYRESSKDTVTLKLW